MSNRDVVGFDHKDVELIERSSLYDGFFQMEKITLRHRLFKGGWGGPISREVFSRHAAACLLPYDPRRDEVVLCEQFRVGAMGTHTSPWLLELVAGIQDKDEPLEDVGRREAEEEAGLKVGRVERICGYYPSAGACDEWVELFCGEVDSAGAGGIFGLADEGEDIRARALPREQAMRMLANDQLNNAPAIMALQWLQANYVRIRANWVGQR